MKPSTEKNQNEFSGHSGNSWKTSTLPMICLFSTKPNNRCKKRQTWCGKLSSTVPHHQQREEQAVLDQHIQQHTHHSPRRGAEGVGQLHLSRPHTG
ncbi:hypothetical protein DPMN_014205 [Dreissena polymorpha]|uniref:Uncharacterized protein n=1 Tax=Dreissena polymorpha TaxID=45954 RepID=A0A9D4NAF8_DREPO|nr:hypothetical protein DPMN_014205 [Dreissena polymorpha]